MNARPISLLLAATTFSGILVTAKVPTLGAIQAPAMTGPQKYDAASIKRCEPGRFSVPCVTTEQLIYLAYAAYGARPEEHLVNDDSGTASNSTKVRGGPDWVHSLKEKYLIEATAAGVTDRFVLMGTMLRALLEERFKLKIHRDVEQAALYSLAVAKGGFKLKPMKDGDCDPDGPPMPDSNAAKPNCGNVNTNLVDGKIRWTFGGFDMANLSGRLSRTLPMHVMDNTNTTDKFVYRFEYLRAPDPLVTESSILSAVEEQLGLKLEKSKGPRGFLVIEAIERPTPDLPAVFEAPLRARATGDLR